MSTTLRIDTSELISGALVIGDTGGGVLGSTIPASGDSGPGYAYNDLNLPADNNKEIMGRVLTYPSAGTLTTFEDTSFTFSGAPDGSYTFTYQLYVDYVAVGSPATVTINIGNGNVTLTSQSTLTGGLTTQIKLQASTLAASSLSANLSTSLNVNSTLFSVSSISANLTGGTTNWQATLSGNSTASGDLKTGVTFATLMQAVSTFQASLTTSGTGNIQPGDKLVIELMGQPYTITLT